MPTGTEPVLSGSDFYIHVPVRHLNGVEFNLTVGGSGPNDASVETAVQNVLDYLNAWPLRDPESEPVAARKNFLQQYLITSPVPDPEPEE